MAKVVAFPGKSVPAASDVEARERALNIRTSCIVEAPAGSGKTGLLVQRYLKLLADDAVQAPEEVLAVTFTRKATAELRERVLQQLVAAQRDAPLAEDAAGFERTSRELALAALERSNQLNWGLLAQPLRLNIQTFDAVGMQIANAMPMLSGSGGPREPIDNASTLHRLAARRTLMQLGGKDEVLHQALRTLLLHRDGSLPDCEALIAQMLEKREQWAELIPLGRSLHDRTLDEEVRPRLERALEAIVCSGLERAIDAMPPGALEALCAIANKLSISPGYRDNPSPIAICSTKDEPPEATPEHLDHWLALIHLLLKKDGEWRRPPNSFYPNILGITLEKHDRTTLGDYIASIETDALKLALQEILLLPPARYPEEQWRVAKALFYILRRALAELKLLFASGGECDFSELALAAREALRLDGTASDLALSSGGTLRHLLIDEMQDTSAGQYELIHLLTRSWDGATQTLFLVGDPKQSIYLFRAASVERFLRTMNEARLGDVALTPLRLTANFRSQATLVDGFNASFEKLFLKPEEQTTEAVDVPFVAASATREKTQQLGIKWHTAVLGEELLEDGMDHAQQEARKIRRIIEGRLAMELPAGRAKPWRAAVLGSGRRHLAAVVTEFNTDRGDGKLRFKAIDIDPLGERPEVLDALALTRALLHPADRIAWLAVLHAPWCGLSIADLLALTGDSVSSDATVAMLIAEHRDLLSSQGQQLLDRAWPVLAAAVETLGRSPLAVQVERTWRTLGGDVALSPEQRTNVLRFLAALREVEAEGSRVDLKVLDARLGSLYAEPFAGEAQVELLTIHKSKGLEWDLVLVPGLERGSGHSSQPLLNWLEFDPESPEDEAAVILAPISSKGTSSGALSQWLTNLRGQRELAERKRVFYVASTRAREELHLFAAVKRKKDGTFATPAPSSLLKPCWPAAEQYFADLLSQNAAVVQMPAPVHDDSYGDEGLALAAGAEEKETKAEATPTLQRLPLSFQPAQRFAAAAQRKLHYAAASTLPQAPAFDRPDGSFGVRAFGNVVHRYLQLIAARLVATGSATLLAELPSWQPRLEASLRGEGLAPVVAAKEAFRVLDALTRTMGDPTGLWLLSPHVRATSEGALTSAPDAELAISRSLRFDRTFMAAEEPLAAGDKTIWIIDFKTTEQGSLSDEAFEAAQRAKYSAQLESYAELRRKLPDGHLPIRLGLFYPLVPRLIYWTARA